jgi:hypothetical protein
MYKAALLLLLAGSSMPVFAASCTSDTIQDYASSFGNSSTDCSIGILLYNNFSSSAVPSGATLNLTPNNNLGFDFTLFQTGTSTPFQATTLTTFSIIYEFTIDPAPILGGSSLRMDPPTGDDTISQIFCLDSNPINGFTSCLQNATIIQTQTVSVTSDNGQDADSGFVQFSPVATSYGWVETTFSLGPNANGQPGSFDGVQSLPGVTEGDIQIVLPEPVSLSLMGFGLLALGGAKLIRRRH